MAYVIGIDGGTESLRAHVFDLQGRDMGSGVAPYATAFPMPGRAEQDPLDWWRALGQAVRSAVASAGAAPASISALCVDTTSCTIVALDDEGGPLRPALLWMDVRAAREAQDVLATGDGALAVNGAGNGPVSAEWMIPKALWLKRHERSTYDRAATICEYQDFLMQRLTGRRVASLTNVSMRWHYRHGEDGWPDTLLAALGMQELRRKWPDEVVAAGSVVAPLTDKAASHLGLGKETLVVQGGADAFIGMIGLGVSRPGQVALITGSSHLQLAVAAQPVGVAGLWGSYADVVYPGRHVLEGGQSASGSMIAWLTRLYGPDVDLASLNRDAAAIAPGSDGLFVLDHFQGNRTPYTDAASRGALVGLSLSHGRAHLFRAMIEGICLGTRTILDAMADAGVRPHELVVGGGAARSPLWLQIHADTARLPVRVARAANPPALGCAVLAAVGAGHCPDIDAGVLAMTGTERSIEPDPATADVYDGLLAGYKELYRALKGWREIAAGVPESAREGGDGATGTERRVVAS